MGPHAGHGCTIAVIQLAQAGLRRQEELWREPELLFVFALDFMLRTLD